MSNISPPDLIRIFQLLGAEMKTWCSDEALLSQVAHENAWFQPEQTRRAINALVKMLQPDLLHDWFSRYPHLPVTVPKTIGVVMAGNLPMVGFHDWLCVLAAGHRLQVKLSSQDRVLFLKLHAFLAEVAPALYARIAVVEQLHQPDAVIATGSDNTSRYFDYYFRSYPHIIRKNRNSLAILNGSESNEELVALGHDLFDYFGLGCRNVSFLLVPDGYDWKPFWESIEIYSHVGQFHKYFNNYDYQKTVMLVNSEPYFDNGFLLLRSRSGLASPIAVLHYQTYHDTGEIAQFVEQHQSNIQCIVSSNGSYPGSIPFGETQSPGLCDYADGLDVMHFLSGL